MSKVFSTDLIKASESLLAVSDVRVYCATCGVPFLFVNGSEFLEKSEVYKNSSPDKWFVETGIHWCENDFHEIVFEIIFNGNVYDIQSVSKVWDKKLEKDRKINPNYSKALQHPHFYKYRKLVETKAI